MSAPAMFPAPMNPIVWLARIDKAHGVAPREPLARSRAGSTLIALLGAFATWWPVLALLYVPWLAQELACLLAQRSRHALDHCIPDALPMTAGEWLVERISRLRYPIAALVTDRDSDAYWPAARLIRLRD